MDEQRRAVLAASGVGLCGLAAMPLLIGNGRAPRPEVSLLDFRASADRDDRPAFARAFAHLAPTGGVLRLPARRGLGEQGAYRLGGERGLVLDISGLEIVGEGELDTVIEGPDGTVVATPFRPVAGVRVTDLTFRGRGVPMSWNGRFAACDFTFERVNFVAEAGGPYNCVQIVHDHEGVTENFNWIDCTFRGDGRMGVELQNHRHDIVAGDRVPRYRHHRFVRPRVLDQASMGFSFSGAGENVEVSAPYFERVTGALVEGVGCTGLTVRDLRVLADGLRGDDQLVRCSNRFQTRNVIVDGIEITSQRSAPAVARTIVRLDNTQGFRLSRIAATVSHPRADRKALEFGINNASRDGEVTGCDLTTNCAYIISSEGCTNLRIHGNHLRSTASSDVEAIRTVGTSGPSSTLVGGNTYASPRARSFKPLTLAANATGEVTTR